MNLKQIAILSSLSIFAIASSCSKDDDSTESAVSTNGSTKSSGMSGNCQTCHKSGGTGETIFRIGGTVFTSALTAVYPNATVYLYTGPNGTGTLKYTIEVDAKGNFYSTDNIDFTGGLYPAVKGASTTKYMNTAVTTGQCNSCHGVSQDKIWTN